MDEDKFLSFVLSETPKHGHRAWLEAYDSLQRNPTQLSVFLSSREISSTFLAGIDVYGGRIAHFLQQLLQYNPLGQQMKEELDVKKGLTGLIIRRVLLPLLDNEHLHSRDSMFELLISVIHLADRSGLDLVEARLGKIPRLLAKLISDERSSGFLRAWTSKDLGVMRNWTATAVSLAEHCVSDHGIDQELARWHDLQELSTYLHERANAPNPPLDHNDIRNTLGLPPPALALLKTFGLPIPLSEPALLAAIATLEGPRTARIMDAVINSFPCRPCFRHSIRNDTGARPVAAIDYAEERLLGADMDSFEGLLGTNLGIWKICLSSQAVKDLRHSKKEGNFHHIREKLEALASGDWARRSVAKPVGDDTGRFKVRVFQAWYGKNGRILWQVDVGFDESHGKNGQIVRVWRMGDVKEISASLDSVHRAQQTYSSERVVACKANLVCQGRKVPVVFDDSEYTVMENCDPQTTDERTVQDVLITGKFHTLTSTVLDSVLHGQYGSDFPFDVTGKEVEIIKHFRTATFILGRSGTGKTSCLLYKLLGRYLIQNLADGDNPIRQLLLTRSEKLARKLNGEVRLLIDTQLLRVKVSAGMGFDDDAEGEDGDGFEREHAMDGTDEDTTEDLFSLLKEDFPLVCTFGHFLKRLENSISANIRGSLSAHGSSAPGTGQLIDFPVFNAAYWQPSMGRSQASFEPGLVFAEIMGIIKGTTSYISGFRPLTREEYLTMSARLAPTFAAEANRNCIYDIFEAYEAKKKHRGDYDAIDRVKVVLNELTGNSALQRRLKGLFEEVYVDEVQDQRPLEIELLLNLVNNPQGIHFAGDSAQCISKDSTFRFANLKALFYEHFLRTGNTFEQHLAKPELFSLSRNFRSHQGILSLASFVMDLLWRGFPDMVDKLLPEIGQYLGPKPVVFVGSDITKFLKMASNSGTPHRSSQQGTDEQQNNKKQRQIVIVRDREIQIELEAKLDDGSVVFTILESKGMEYDDVFLFDFFSRSPCLSGYRSLKELLGPGANPGYGAAHMTMCSELKNLYVAITRPRNRLWILESGTTFMLNLFTTMVPKPLVDVKHFTPQTLPHLVAEVKPVSATSAREWIETGEQCMESRLFEQALKCFKNANDTRRILWAEGSIAELKGRECRASGDSFNFKVYFGEASRLFIEIGMKERAAGCMEAMGEFARAARIWAEKSRHEKAAGLFEAGEKYSEAAEEYHKAALTSKALQALYNGKLFDQLVRDLNRYRQNIEDGERKVYARECNILLRQSKIDAKYWGDTFNTFITDTEKEAFLEEFKHRAELVEFYLARGRVKEAFEYPVKPGEFENGLEMLFNRTGGANLGQTDTELQLPELFKYTQTSKLLASMARSPGVSIDLKPEEQFSAFEWSRPWASLAVIAHSYFKSGVMPERSNIQTPPWIKDYLDIIVSMRMKYFLRSVKSFTEFPLEYLNGLRKLAHNMSQYEHEMPFPTSLLLCLGVLPIPGVNDSYLILSWSELDMVPMSTRKINGAAVLSRVTTYISGVIGTASQAIGHRARELWVGPEELSKCESCVFRASWSRPSVTQTYGISCSHQIPSKIQFQSTVQGLMTFCAFWDKLGEVESLFEIEHWLAKLETLMTFDSSLSQDAEVMTTMSQTLRKSGIYSSVIERLRLLFLSRTKPSESKEDFTALLKSYRLGLMLGINHGEPIPITHKPQAKKGPRKPSLDLPNIAFDKYQHLHVQFETHPEMVSTGAFCQDVCNLVQDLDKLRKGKKYLSFYNGSVISMYEDILTFLFFSSGTEQIIIPMSWTKLYLPQWETALRATTDLERCCYQQSMLRLVSTFCDLVADLESTHKVVGKPTEDERLIRRSVDLLVISLINIGTITPSPLRYDEIWEKVQKSFTHPRFKMDETRNVKPNQLREHLTRAFKIYNGKDTLQLYVPQERLPGYLKRLDGTGIQLIPLPIRTRSYPWPCPVLQSLDPTTTTAPALHVETPESPLSQPGPDSTPAPPVPTTGSAVAQFVPGSFPQEHDTTPQHQTMGIQNPDGALSKPKPTMQPPEGGVLHAAFLIQALRRRQLAQRSRAEKRLDSSSGRTISILQNFCAIHRDRKPSRVDYLRFVSVMVTAGLELHTLLGANRFTFEKLLAVPVELNLPESETRNLEFEAYSKRVSPQYYWGLFTEPAVFDLSSDELYEECKKGLGLMKILEGELGQFMERLQEESRELERVKTTSNKKTKGKKKKGNTGVGGTMNKDEKNSEGGISNEAGKGGKKNESVGATEKAGESSTAGAGGAKEQKPTEQQKGAGKKPNKGGSSADVPWKPGGGGRRSVKNGGSKKSRKR